MPLLTFHCVACGKPLHCQEGAGELFRCPHCEHVGTVPQPFGSGAQAAPRRVQSRRSQEPVAGVSDPGYSAVADGVWDETTTRRWRRTARGLRFIHSSLWVLVLFTGLILVIDLGAALFFLDSLNRNAPGWQTAAAFIGLTMVPLMVVALLQELIGIIGQCLCVCVPAGGNRRLVAIAALLATLVLWTAGVIGSVLFVPKLQQLRPNAPLPGDVIAWYVALNFISFLRWLATVDFAKLVARAMDDRRTARSASLLTVTAVGVCFLAILLAGISTFMSMEKNQPDPLTAFALVGLAALIGLVSLALVFWYLSVLRRAYRAIESSLEQPRDAEP